MFDNIWLAFELMLRLKVLLMVRPQLEMNAEGSVQARVNYAERTGRHYGAADTAYTLKSPALAGVFNFSHQSYMNLKHHPIPGTITRR